VVLPDRAASRGAVPNLGGRPAVSDQDRDHEEPIEIEVEGVEVEGVEEADESGDAGSGREEYRVRGEDLLSRIKEIVREGNVRRITIRSDEGNTLIEIPLAIGVAGALLLPVWAAVGAVAALVANCTITVERRAD
jgi:hypothetical protein